jgi:hypothetical protein
MPRRYHACAPGRLAMLTNAAAAAPQIATRPYSPWEFRELRRRPAACTSTVAEATMGFLREEDVVAVERMYPGIHRLYRWARPTSLLDLLTLYERWPREAAEVRQPSGAAAARARAAE